MKNFLLKYVSIICGVICCSTISQAQITIHYAHNEHVPKADDIAIIRKAIQANPHTAWLVTGQTSSSGSKEYNQKLSKKRTDDIVYIMKQAGISMDSITITPLGEENANQAMDDANDRKVTISFLQIPTLREKVTEPAARTFPLEITVWDGLDIKPISGSYTMNDITTDFKDSIHLELANRTFQKIKISSPGYRDSIIIVEPRSLAYRVELLPNKVLEKLVFGNIYFFPSSAEILPESFRALDELYAQLKNKSDINIEIRGHINWPIYMANSPELEIEHQALSDQRAMAVMNWLIKKGIPAKTLSYRGFSNKQMLYPNASTEGQMAYNRRVEVILLKQ